MPSKRRVAVLGAGASGLTAIKACAEEGLDVVCYEKTNNIGGLWRYTDEVKEGLASVMRSTIINSSKEMSAFSDFPPPVEFPNYMHNSMMIRYIELYAEHYGMTSKVNLEHEVLLLEPTEDHEETKRWRVKVRDVKANKEFQEEFDGVMVCTGHHVYPIKPKFMNQEKFKGRIMHTHDYKRPVGFDDHNVVVIGVGNSGGDVAVELSNCANKVYLSTRRGCWIIFRVGPNGQPFDAQYLRRAFNFLFHLSPYSIACYFAERKMNQRFDHQAYNLKPKHRIFGQHPMVNDALPNRILSGTVVVKGNIKEFTENGIFFEGEDQEYPVDDVILATGYKVHFPFIDEKLIPVQDNKIDVYKLVFPPQFPTLALIGLAQPVGGLMPISEMQSRWVARIFSGRASLPPEPKMKESVKRFQEWMKGRYFSGPRNTLQIDWIDYMDDLASRIGAKPNITRLSLTDPFLAYHVFTGPCIPYQYRLEGPHAWEGARDAILEYEDRVRGALNTRHSPAIKQRRDTALFNIVNVGGFIFMLFLAFLVATIF